MPAWPTSTSSRSAASSSASSAAERAVVFAARCCHQWRLSRVSNRSNIMQQATPTAVPVVVPTNDRLDQGLFDRESHDVSEYHWNLVPTQSGYMW